MPESAAIPLHPKATAPFFCKYSGLPTPEHLERLRVIVQEHEIYLPTQPQPTLPIEGQALARLSEDEMTSLFLYTISSRTILSYRMRSWNTTDQLFSITSSGTERNAPEGH